MLMSMRPEAIAGFPIWAAGLLLAGGAIAGAILIELIARRLFPSMLREEHNPVAAAIFSVIGTTYAVLLAFVAMLAWDGSNHARDITASEASLISATYELVGGLTSAERDELRHDLIAYARRVAGTEWPALAAGRDVSEQEPHLTHATQTALRLRPDNVADTELWTLIVSDLASLDRARQARLHAARATIPTIVWVVLIAGGAITVAFGSFLGAPSLRMHLAMSSLLALSGALVLLVIVALSSPFRGDFGITAEPFERTLTRMQAE